MFNPSPMFRRVGTNYFHFDERGKVLSGNLGPRVARQLKCIHRVSNDSLAQAQVLSRDLVGDEIACRSDIVT